MLEALFRSMVAVYHTSPAMTSSTTAREEDGSYFEQQLAMEVGGKALDVFAVLGISSLLQQFFPPTTLLLVVSSLLPRVSNLRFPHKKVPNPQQMELMNLERLCSRLSRSAGLPSDVPSADDTIALPYQVYGVCEPLHLPTLHGRLSPADVLDQMKLEAATTDTAVTTSPRWRCYVNGNRSLLTTRLLVRCLLQNFLK